MNKVQRALRDAGYSGQFRARSVLDWLDETNTSLSVGGVRIDASTDVKTVTIAVSADAGEEVVVEDASAEEYDIAADDDGEEPAKSWTPRRRERGTGLSKSQRATQRIMREVNAPYIGSQSSLAVKRYNRKAQAVNSRGHRQTVFTDGDVAEAAGAWMRLALVYKTGVSYPDRQRDVEIVRAHGIDNITGKAHATNDNAAGGALIPDAFDPDLVYLQEQFGVARQIARVTRMSENHITRPRLTDDIAVYWTGENSTLTSDDLEFDNISMTCNKLTALSLSSTEILQDSAVNIADELGRSIAHGFNSAEDDAILNGDGSSTYGGFTGWRSRLLNDGTANVAYYDASESAWSALDLGDHHSTMALLPQFADERNPFWVVSKQYWDSVMTKLAVAGGGNNATDIVNGVPVKKFLGYDVVVSQKMPRAESNGTVNAMFGAFELGAMFGEHVSGRQIATSDQRYFEMDQVAIKGTERVAINVHDYGGTDTDDPNSPVVGLVL